MATNELAEAEALFRSGRLRAGLETLERAGSKGDADALLALATMSLTGQVVRRNLALSRDLFRQAADAGCQQAAAAYRAFVANGTGGPSDWRAALQLLEQAAQTDRRAEQELRLIASMQLDPDGEPIDNFTVERVSESPEAAIFRSLFSAEECAFLIQVATPMFQPSTVVDPVTGRLVANPIRTSDAAAFPWVDESPAIHSLCRRMARASGTNVKQGEPLQILRYLPGQEYRPHFDALGQTDNQRILTFLVYLNEDYEGGGTRFMKSGLTVKGRKGDALLFRNADDSGRPDPNSQHAGEPVTAGEKFIASRWIRQRALLSD